MGIHVYIDNGLQEAKVVWWGQEEMVHFATVQLGQGNSFALLPPKSLILRAWQTGLCEGLRLWREALVWVFRVFSQPVALPGVTQLHRFRGADFCIPAAPNQKRGEQGLPSTYSVLGF